MRQQRAPLLSSEEVRHTIYQLGREDHVIQKTLQWLEGELRCGRYPADPRELRARVTQCVHRPSVGVKRWALNVLAELGLGKDFTALEAVVPFTRDDPDLLASAVRLLFREARHGDAIGMLNVHGLSTEGLALIAAAEYSRPLAKRLVNERIPLDHATSDELRAAIVLTGRGKAPENLFSAHHTNAVALSELNLHDEPGVTKYSLWALAELGLGFSSLKINISQYDSCDPQVRKWILRLLFSDELALSRNIDLIWHGAKDDAVEVREEAAIGLSECYVKGAAKEIMRWYVNEPEPLVREALIDHFALYSHRDERYAGLIVEEYQRSQVRSEVRDRIEARVRGTDLYGQLKMLELKQQTFALMANNNGFMGWPMTKNEINIHNSQVGLASTSGVATANQVTFNAGASAEALPTLLSQFLSYLNSVDNPEFKRQGEEIAQQIAQEPKKSLLERAVNLVKLASSGAQAGSDLATSGGELIEGFTGMMGLLAR